MRTLIEVIEVIVSAFVALLGLLAVVAIVAAGKVRDKVQDDIEQMKYLKDHK